ncbi:leucine-rich repeat domain-containing protein [Aeromicrobium sp.]|uniref:leucine-rich repeat domain-containing protein n=1 Tax=Aeromicrobium sp. TaxID=1871063 RepID=UPI002FCA5EE9
MLGSKLSTQIRLAALLAALTAVFGVMTLMAPSAHAVTVTVTSEKGVTFTANDAAPEQGATVTAYDESFGPDVTIPQSVTIEGTEYAVKKVGFQAFYDKGLASVTIEADLTSIGQNSFGLNSLTNFTIPNTVTAIGSTAFAGNDLTAIVIPDSVTSMGQNVFAINNIATATLSSNLTTIPESTFESNALTSIKIPNGVTSIGTYAFWGNSLSAVTVPSSVTSIGNRSFDFNSGLSSVAFSGAAPTVFDAGTAEESFDTASGSLVVRYRPEYAASFASPWHGYTTEPYLEGFAPTITGKTRETYTLTAVPGPVESDATLGYQWNVDGTPIVGATSATYIPKKTDAGRRLSVTVKATYLDTDPLVKTSPTTTRISSPYKRLVLASTTVHRGESFPVVATGFKKYQRVKIILGGVTRYVGRANSVGTVAKWVTFKSTTNYGTRSVRVSGYDSDWDRTSTIVKYVTYVR